VKQEFMPPKIEKPSRHVVIGGGSGFIGSALAKALRARRDRVTIISREPGADRITWGDIERTGLPPCDAVVNLAGQHILNLRRRWNAEYREEVIQSRIKTTTVLVQAINRSETPPELFISTAGKCFYGTREMDTAERHPELDEDSQPMGIDFPAELVAR
jgi:NAD dependent epimerase/dehydratase family enzyme